MNKGIKKTLYILLLVAMALTLFACKKKVQHKWIEVGADPNPPKVEPGIHPERGTVSDAVPIVTVMVYVPMGMQEKVVVEPIDNKTSTSDNNKQSSSKNSSNKNKKTTIRRDYVTKDYEMYELTPENVDKGLKEYGVISEDMELYSFEIVPDDNAVSAGPIDKDKLLTQKGIVKYVDFISSPLINFEEYENKLNDKDLIGKIDGEDIVNCIIDTYASAFNLTNCEVLLVDANGNVKQD